MKISGKEYVGKTSIVRRDAHIRNRFALTMDHVSKEVIREDACFVHGSSEVMELETDDAFDSFSVTGLGSRHDTVNSLYPGRKF